MGDGSAALEARSNKQVVERFLNEVWLIFLLANSVDITMRLLSTACDAVGAAEPDPAAVSDGSGKLSITHATTSPP